MLTPAGKPNTIAKFRLAGDFESVRILEIIHHDEITVRFYHTLPLVPLFLTRNTIQHVTAGHRWHSYICSQLGVDPVATFRTAVQKHFTGPLKGPFNEEDRR